MNTFKLIDELTIDEGKRNKPYKDSVGKLTIGVGRNLDDVGVSDDEIALMLQNDINRTMAKLRANLTWFDVLSEIRQRVLANMAFNMGVDGMLKFTKTLGLVKAGRYDEAAAEMLNSTWAKQVGVRATRLATMMKNG